MAGHNPLGIIAGRGVLPGLVARGVQAQGREVFVVGIEAEEELRAFPHVMVNSLEPMQIVENLLEQKCCELVIVGGVRWPSAAEMTQIQERLRRALSGPVVLERKGNKGATILAVRFLEECFGFQVRSPDEVLESLGVPEGLWVGEALTEENERDIQQAVETLEVLAQLDVGQGVVVCRGRVLAVEAQEGTDAMLEGVARLDPHLLGDERMRAGVLVKLPHPDQDRRIDLPTVGPETVWRASQARLAGIVVRAHGALLASWEDVKSEILKEKMFFKALER